MNTLKSIAASIITVAVLSLIPCVTTFAADTPATTGTGTSSNPAGDISTGVQAVGGGSANQGDLNAAIRTVVNVLLYILGAIAVIMIVIGGIRYATSNGDSSQLTAAKNTIMYAVVGVIVALAAYAIVNFFIVQFKK